MNSKKLTKTQQAVLEELMGLSETDMQNNTWLNAYSALWSRGFTKSLPLNSKYPYGRGIYTVTAAGMEYLGMTPDKSECEKDNASYWAS